MQLSAVTPSAAGPQICSVLSSAAGQQIGTVKSSAVGLQLRAMESLASGLQNTVVEPSAADLLQLSDLSSSSSPSPLSLFFFPLSVEVRRCLSTYLAGGWDGAKSYGRKRVRYSSIILVLCCNVG
jgi:hypothetical protein